MRLREELKKIRRQSIARFDRVDNAQISRTDTQTHRQTHTPWGPMQHIQIRLNIKRVNR